MTLKFFASSLLAIAVAGCATMPEPVAPAATETAISAKDAEDAVVADLLARMSLEKKIGQLIQPQINSFTAEDMERYRFGSYLNGGNGGPYGDELAPASEWLRLANEMYEASIKPLPGDEPAIPTMWGTDAVHGHTNVVGATVFPHNVGLGATHDVDLVRRIGAATAIEIEVTGIDWNFSPTVAVARDDRWGRAYESYSEDPQLVAKMGAALVEGSQGLESHSGWLGERKVIATAKHFFADGGTNQGVDTGDALGDMEALKAIHATPYPVAINAGVQVVMASFSSINGEKMHGNAALLTDYLRGELGFDGLVVGDWNGHGQIPGCKVDDCPHALNAGLDVYMVPDNWKRLIETLVEDVEDGTVPMARLDEAVARVLRVKYRAGLLGPDAKKPSERGVGGQFDLLGSPDHRSLAREAVAKSQVILKNDGVLPLKAGSNLLVAGTAADSIAGASGGWTLTWQGGGDLTNADFPGATSIFAGIEEAARAGGGSATLSADGSYDQRPDAAIVVFGEKPYAEFYGDLKSLVLSDEEGLTLLSKFQSDGIPTVAVFLSGRPMWMNRELNAANAFVASWLPGSEGGGIADILTGAREATGRLSFSWPAGCSGTPVNGPDGALFQLGYGRSLADTTELAELDETCGYLDVGPSTDLFANGRLAEGTSAVAGTVTLTNLLGSANGITAKGIDRLRQEDAREISFEPGATLSIAGSDQGGGDFVMTYSLPDAPVLPVILTVGGDRMDIAPQLRVAAGKDWREMVITERCMPGLGDGIEITSEGPLTLRIASIERREMPEGTDCSF